MNFAVSPVIGQAHKEILLRQQPLLTMLIISCKFLGYFKAEMPSYSTVILQLAHEEERVYLSVFYSVCFHFFNLQK